MPTDLPKNFSVEFDYSALDAHTKSVNARSKARVIVAIGAASLAAGAGIGLGAWGISHLIEPKVVTVEKPVVQKEIERVEIPKIVEHEKIVTVEKPVVIEKQVPAPQSPAAPAIKPAPSKLDRTADQEFENSPEFQAAEFHGRIRSIEAGEIQFDNGRKLLMADGAGRLAHSPTTTKFNGDMAFCRYAGDYANGRKRWPCTVLHEGHVENLRFSGAESAPWSSDPLAELFN
jgi:hypothetical protein